MSKGILFFTIFVSSFFATESASSFSENRRWVGGIEGSVIGLYPHMSGAICGCGKANVVETVNSNGGTDIITLCRDKDLKIPWNLGGRLSLFAKAISDAEKGYWDFGALWTYFQSGRRESLENHYSGKLRYNSFDALFGYTFLFDSGLDIKVFGGGKGSIVDQVTYRKFIHEEDNGGLFSSKKIVGEEKQHFLGLGPELGSSFKYTLWQKGSKRIRAYGSLLLSTLYGYSRLLSYEFSKSEVDSDYFSRRRSLRMVNQTSDISLGLLFEIKPKERVSIHFKGGYEQARIWGFNEFCKGGDLSLSGFSFSFLLEF